MPPQARWIRASTPRPTGGMVAPDAGGVHGRAVQSGTVVVGRRLGRLLGAPTANIPLDDPDLAAHGSFAVEVYGLARTYRGCAHVGSCPSVGGTTVRLEVHLFDFDGDLYGKRLTVRFFEKVSEEARLGCMDALRAKIASDLAACVAYFRQRDDVDARS